MKMSAVGALAVDSLSCLTLAICYTTQPGTAPNRCRVVRVESDCRGSVRVYWTPPMRVKVRDMGEIG